MTPLRDVIEDMLPPMDVGAGEKGGKWRPARHHSISDKKDEDERDFIVSACSSSVKMRWHASRRSGSNGNSLLHRIETTALDSPLSFVRQGIYLKTRPK